MKDDRLIPLIQTCLNLEKCGLRFYRTLSHETKEENLKKFWKDMAIQEGYHIQYWEQLMNLAEKKKIKIIFDDPDKVITELNQVSNKVNQLLKEKIGSTDIEKMFLTAYRIEFYILHPAFAAMFHLMRKETGDTSPEDQYEAHISGLINKLSELGQSKPHFEMIARLMKQIWNNNRQLARQLADIKVLRGLIPICMHCKNVRNDEGFWGKVENYIEDHSEAQFSHGICPDCLNKYYPEFGEP